jgi:hypothetical protein
MNTLIEVATPSVLTDIDRDVLSNHIDDVLNGNLPGFVVNDKDSAVFQASANYATELGLSGGINSTTMTFDYDATLSDLAPGKIPEPEDWEQFGITPLHTDGEEGEKMLSLSICLLGAYSIYILDRGPDILDESPIELWDSLHEDSVRILTENMVNSDKLNNRITRLDIAMGQTVIFNPSRPHMGVTTQAPRRVNTTFFH